MRSDTREFVSQPPLSNPPPSGPTVSPPKMDVSRRMNVDFPQPESAATPITTTYFPVGVFVDDHVGGGAKKYKKRSEHQDEQTRRQNTGDMSHEIRVAMRSIMDKNR